MHKKTTLKNGLRVITYPMKGTSTVTLLVVVQAGSKYETKEINGISHFLEHMFFKGTNKRPTAQEISETLDMLGGEFNAFTSKEWTGYYVKADTKHVDLLFDVISDMFLHSKIDAKELEREKGVIIEEMNMYQDTPTRYIEDLIEVLLYGKDQPAGWLIIGSKENIKNMTHGQMRTYLNERYVAKNTAVILAGDIQDHESVEKKVQEYFNDISEHEPSDKLPVIEDQKKPEILLHYKETDQSHLEMAFRAYRSTHKDIPALNVLSTILGGNMSSRLFINIRERHGLCYYIRSGVTDHIDSGYLNIRAGVDNQRFKMALEMIMGELKKVLKDGVKDAEINKAKEYISGKMNLNLETSSDFAFWIAEQEIIKDKIRTKEEILEKINAVTREDVKRVAEDIFINSKLNLAVIGQYKDKSEFEHIIGLLPNRL